MSCINSDEQRNCRLPSCLQSHRYSPSISQLQCFLKCWNTLTINAAHTQKLMLYIKIRPWKQWPRTAYLHPVCWSFVTIFNSYRGLKVRVCRECTYSGTCQHFSSYMRPTHIQQASNSNLRQDVCGFPQSFKIN